MYGAIMSSFSRFFKQSSTSPQNSFQLIILFLQAAPVNIIVGSHVWVEDPVLAWVDGEVFKISGEEVHVHTTNGKTVS